MTKLYIELISNTPLPKQGTTHSAGFDVCAVIKGGSEYLVINPREVVLVPLGMKIRPETGYCTKLFMRSGLSTKGIGLANSVGLIDEDFSHECSAILINNGNKKIAIKDGERIGQIKVERVEPTEIIEVDSLPPIETNRIGGFGSTGH